MLEQTQKYQGFMLDSFTQLVLETQDRIGCSRELLEVLHPNRHERTVAWPFHAMVCHDDSGLQAY